MVSDLVVLSPHSFEKVTLVVCKEVIRLGLFQIVCRRALVVRMALRDHVVIKHERWHGTLILEVQVQFLVKVILVFDTFDAAILDLDKAIVLDDEATDWS